MRFNRRKAGDKGKILEAFMTKINKVTIKSKY